MSYQVDVGHVVTAKDVNFIVIRVQETCFDTPPHIALQTPFKKIKEAWKEDAYFK
jgi:hypothetical protein